MKTRLKWLLFFLLVTSKAVAQYENVWVFGSHAGLDFNSGPVVALQTGVSGFAEAAAAVCGDNGDLLFYTEGSKVWDKNHNLMPGGHDLAVLPSADGFTTTTSTSQGALIVPVPDSTGKFYIFSLTSTEQAFDAGRLYFSVVDMDLNGGLGDLVAGRKGILLDSMLTEKMAGVVGDKCNLWVVVQAKTGAFRSYEIMPSGLIPVPVISNTPVPAGNIGVMKFSPDRHKLAACGGVQLFDFDPLTGMVSNGVLLDNLACYGVCFSPDGSKLYAGDYINQKLFQYDLSLSGIPAVIGSKTDVGSAVFSDIKSAPDGKIYLKGSSNNMLSAINFPDLAGTSCQFVPDVVQLAPGSSLYAGLPNNVPVFRREYVSSSRTISAGCWPDFISLNADTSGWDYIWDDGSSGIIRTVNGPGVYWVTYHTPPCKQHTDTFRVMFPYPALPLTGVTEGCKGSSYPVNSAWVVPVAGDTTTYGYTWSANGIILRHAVHAGPDTLAGLNAGIYRLSVHAASGCDTSLDLTIAPVPAKASFLTDTSVCQIDTIAFINTSDAVFTEWYWIFGDGDTSSLAYPLHHFTQPGIYNVILVAVTAASCFDSATLRVQVDSMPAIRYSVDSKLVCEGSAVSFFPVYTRGADSLLWNFSDGYLSSRIQPVHSFDSTGNYTVRVDAFYPNCPDTFYTDTITVVPYPQVDLGIDTSVCPGGDPVLIADRSPVNMGYRFQWNTGDTLSAIRVRHPGTYALTVTSEHNCHTTDSIDVFKSCYIDIPNAFTPDGDGVNDYFFPRQLLSEALTGFHMKIFNRWGVTVYETQQIGGRGWDGRYNDREQPQGVYVYIIEAEINGVYREKYQGNLTLLR